MAQTTVTFRMDEDLKKEFDSICDTLGMSMSTAFIVYAKQMVRRRGIPFEVTADPFYSEGNVKYVKNGIEQLGRGQTVSKTIEELDGLINE